MRLWKQAQADNPDPENYIPVPIIGFSEVHITIMTKLQYRRVLKIIVNDQRTLLHLGMITYE
jgi:hypothetical protein